jgi:hypothetical protein
MLRSPDPMREKLHGNAGEQEKADSSATLRNDKQIGLHHYLKMIMPLALARTP